jgi:hypothetical protein
MTSPHQLTSQDLPNFLDLEEAPELGPIALLRAAISVTQTALEASMGPAATLREAVEWQPGCDVPLLARLAVDRCRELDELLACYRIAVMSPRHDPDDDDSVF